MGGSTRVKQWKDEGKESIQENKASTAEYMFKKPNKPYIMHTQGKNKQESTFTSQSTHSIDVSKGSYIVTYKIV